MATVWGAYKYRDAYYGQRLGINLGVSGTTITAWYYAQNTGSVYQTYNLTRTGAVTGAVSVSWNCGSACTTNINTATKAGSRGSTYTFGASMPMFWGATLSVSGVSIKVPAVAPSKPAKPTITAESPTSAKASLSAAPAANGASITNYRWEFEGKGQYSSGTTRSQTATGLTPGASYRVRVYATNSAGSSAWSDWSASVTLGVLAPTSVPIPTLTRVSDTSTTLSWTAASTSERPWTTVEILRETWNKTSKTWGSPEAIASVAGSVTSYTATGQSADNVYRYSLRVINSGGTTTGGTVWIRTTPAAPTGLVATKAANNADIVVAGTANEQGFTAGGAYTYEWQDNPGGTGWVDVAGTTSTPSRTFVGPSADQTHQYRSRAKIGALAAGSPVLPSAWSAPSNVVQLQAPPLAPTLVAPAANASLNRAQAIPFSWVHNAVDGSKQTAAEFAWRPNSSAAWTVVPITGAAASYTLPAPNASYAAAEWRVRTKGADPNFGPWSTARVFRTSASPVVTITAPVDPLNTSMVTASWTYSAADSAPAQSYALELYRGAVSAANLVESTVVNAPALSTVFAQLVDNETTYTLRIRATNNVGLTGGWASRTFTTDFPFPFGAEINANWDRKTGSNLISFSPVPQNFAPPIKTDGAVNVPVYTNASTRQRGTTSWVSNDSGRITVDANQSVPQKHPLGITTCNKLSFARAAVVEPLAVRDAFGLYGAGGSTEYRYGVWMFAPFDGLLGVVAKGSEIATAAGTPLPANQWTFVESATTFAPGSGTASPFAAVRLAPGEAIPADAATLRPAKAVYTSSKLYADDSYLVTRPTNLQFTDNKLYFDSALPGDNAYFGVTKQGWVTAEPLAGGAAVPNNAPISVYMTGSIAVTAYAPLTSFIPSGYFDGTYNDDPDLTPQWVGTANQGPSRVLGRAVPGWSNGAGAAAILSHLADGKPAVRVIPNAHTPGSAYASASIPSALRSGGHAVANLYLPESQKGSLDASARALWVTSPTQRTGVAERANETGYYAQSLPYTALSSTYQLRLGNGADAGCGDTYWSDVSLYAQEYFGPWVDPAAQLPIVSLDVQRRWNDGPWETIARNLPADSAFTDYLPPTSGTVCYRTVTWSSLGTNYNGPEICQVFENATLPCPDRSGATDVLQHAWINFGAEFSLSALATLGLSIESPTLGKEDVVLHRFSGQSYPVQYVGEGLTEVVAINFVAGPDKVDGEALSTAPDWRVVADHLGPLFYRDYLGAYFPVSMGTLSFKNLGRGYWQISGQLRRIECQVNTVEGS